MKKLLLLCLIVVNEVCGQTANVFVTKGDASVRFVQQNSQTFGGCQGGIPTITLDPDTQHQIIDGFGASLTESSAFVLKQLQSSNAALFENVMNQLFNPVTGAGISILRVTISSTDFSLSPRYTYNDAAGDSGLNTFSTARDDAYMKPILRRALQINPNLRLIATPWSAPIWMKTSNDWGYGSLKSEFFDTYAFFWTKVLWDYKNSGLPFWAITLQNEPAFEPGGYPGMKMTAQEQIRLGNLVSQKMIEWNIPTKMLAWDHNWDKYQFAIDVLTGTDVFAGSAFHCYGGDVSKQSLVHNAFPNKELHFTECSATKGSFNNFGGDLGWAATNLYIGAIKNWAQSVLHWNLALDGNFGPKSGGCDDCRGHVNILNGNVIEYSPEYYAQIHFSRFLSGKNARRIGSSGDTASVTGVAFKAQNGDLTTVIQNSGGSQTVQVSYNGQCIRFPMANGLVTFNWSPTTSCGSPSIGTGDGVRGEYYGDTTLTKLSGTQIDPTIDWDYGTGGPKSPIGVDKWSIRWTGGIQPKFTGVHTFTINSDDGVRLWVNGIRLINDWTGHGAYDTIGTILLTAGFRYDLRLEFFDDTSVASIHFYWSVPNCLAKEIVPKSQLYSSASSGSCVVSEGSGNGLTSAFYSGQNFGTLITSRTDPLVQFDWGNGAPATGVPADNWSARFTGLFQAKFSGSTTFYVTSDDGVRLWINNALVIDNWVGQPATEKFGSISLNAGSKYNIKLEYFDSTGLASIVLSYSHSCAAKTVIPTSQLYSSSISTLSLTLGSGNGLAGKYFNDTTFTSPVGKTIENINFFWPEAPNDIDMIPDNFTVRWEGQIQSKFNSEVIFETLAIGGTRLWIQEELVIDNWLNNVTEGVSAPIQMNLGSFSKIKLEYISETEDAQIELYWKTNDNFTKEIIPTEWLYDNSLIDTDANPTLETQLQMSVANTLQCFVLFFVLLIIR